MQGLGGLRQQIEARIQQGRYPGAVFAVAHREQVLDLSALGVADIDTKAPMRPDAVFRLMSMTKPVTAVAAMILVEEGKLPLDGPVSSVLPEFTAFGVPGAPPMTLRHLLTHTSGIGFGTLPMKPATLAGRVRETADRSIDVPTGTVWAYSGVEGGDVVARMIEVAAGEPYDRFLQRRLFDPLGMKDTTYNLSPAQEQRLVGLYAAEGGKVTHAAPMLPQPTYPSGGAGLYSTAGDYLRFVQMLAGDGALGKVRILKPTSVEEIRRQQLPAGQFGLPPGLAWGLMVRHIADPAAVKSPLNAGAFGWSGAYGTHFWIDPKTGVSAVWMVNLTTAGGASSVDALDFEQMVMAACRIDHRCTTQ